MERAWLGVCVLCTVACGDPEVLGETDCGMEDQCLEEVPLHHESALPLDSTWNVPAFNIEPSQNRSAARTVSFPPLAATETPGRPSSWSNRRQR